MRSPKRGEASRRSTTVSFAAGDLSVRNASISAWVGGRPVRSKVTRRNQRSGEACGLGLIFSFSRRARMNESMGFSGHVLSAVSGTAISFGGVTKAQCASYSAPCPTQVLIRFFSFSVRVRWDFGGGMTSLGSLEKIRISASESGGFSGSQARALIASARISRRRSASCFSLSGPWQKKHLSERMGRITRA